MSRYDHADYRDGAGATTEIATCLDGGGKSREVPADGGASPRLQVRAVERTAIVRFTDSEILFEEEAVHAVGRGLRRLIGEGHTRLVVNFAGVRYISSEVLGILAGLQKEIDRVQG